ncbi:MAG: GntR family transcriptional regulator [Lactobacillus sp.]|jgi:DNA-binding transcriptional regulator YhcF (GntR family)|nr:GntR family transcriptional regulator [Lactobacillus sp.]
MFHFNDEEPIYQQIADQLMAAIMTGSLAEGDQVPSTTAIAKGYQINPATVLKGMNQLVDLHLIEKRRGLGMFVQTGAQQQARTMRQAAFSRDFIKPLLQEAKRLALTNDQLLKLIQEATISD